MIAQLVGRLFEKDMEEQKISHIPVMLKEVVEYLSPKPGGIFVDCTIGLGGHAKTILDLIGLEGRLIGIDRDLQSLEVAKQNLSAYAHQCDFVHEDYRNVDKILENLSIEKVDGILVDLGISSFQLNNPERGFSIQTDGPLDMRMDQEGQISAYDLVNSLSENEISMILKNFGQERWHYRIARYIVFQRSKKLIETTQELSQIVLRAIPYKRRREKIHPATRTFQAFRIAVNRELESLDLFIDKGISLLKPGGRIGIIAFHSLEDKIVKEKFRSLSKLEKASLLCKKPLRPTDEEVRENSRARSARFRVAERM